MSGPHIYDPQFHVTAGLERPAVQLVGPVAHVFPVLVASDPLVPGGPLIPYSRHRALMLSSPMTARATNSFLFSSTVFLSHGIQALPFSFVLYAVILLKTVNDLPEQTVNNHTSLYSPHRPETSRNHLCTLNGTGQRDNNTTFSRSTGPWNKPPLGGTMCLNRPSTNKFAVHAIVVAFHAESLTKGAIPV